MATAETIAGWLDACNAKTPVERELLAECVHRAGETGCTVRFILMEAEHYWNDFGRITEPRKWKSRVTACRRMLAAFDR